MPSNLLPYASYSALTMQKTDTLGMTDTKMLVLKETYFQSMANLTQVEFVPLTAGKINIRVRY